MLFTEYRFFAFFALVLIVYWALRGNGARKLWLLVCSYGFYAAWDWRFLSLILISTTVDYVAGLRPLRGVAAAVILFDDLRGQDFEVFCIVPIGRAAQRGFYGLCTRGVAVADFGFNIVSGGRGQNSAPECVRGMISDVVPADRWAILPERKNTSRLVFLHRDD